VPDTAEQVFGRLGRPDTPVGKPRYTQHERLDARGARILREAEHELAQRLDGPEFPQLLDHAVRRFGLIKPGPDDISTGSDNDRAALAIGSRWSVEAASLTLDHLSKPESQ